MTENTIHSQFGEITFDSIESIPNDALLEELVDLSIALFENKPNHEYFSALKQKPALILLARNSSAETRISESLEQKRSLIIQSCMH